MSDAPRIPEEGEGIPQAVPHKPEARHFQLVWVIPIVAILVGGWIALKNIMDRGPTITIQFKSAEGIEAGKTRIRHKSVDIGIVRGIRLSEDFKQVIVTAEMDSHVSTGFLVDDTRFWVVRPRIAGGQVSGLSTLLAGSYIGADPGKAEKERRAFSGLETPPPISSDVPGRQFTLLGEDLGSLDIGSQVYFRGINAGSVVSTEVAPDGKRVRVGVFVHWPYDRFVNAESRFWNESGVDLALDATGVRLQTQSLVTMVLGGIAFETPNDAPAQAPAAANTQFPLWDNRTEAFKPREAVVAPFVLKFAQSVRGLAIGAPVDFRGILVGEVKRVDLEFDPATVRFLTVVEVHLWPERLRSRYRNPERAALPELTPPQRIQRFVERGFRAQLRNANLITGQLYVALDFFPKAPKAAIDLARTPPEIPTIPGGLAELQESLANIVAKFEKVPFDLLAQDVRKALASLEVTLGKADAAIGKINTEIAPELHATLDQARRTLTEAQKALATDSPLQGDLRETLSELTRAAESVRALTDYLERHPESLIRGKRPAGDRK